jgi:hypothetical protein
MIEIAVLLFSSIFVVVGLWCCANWYGWHRARRDDQFLSWNWRVFLGPPAYFSWLDRDS